MKECALAIVFNHDQTELLLTKRRDVPLWVLPGGGIEPEEKTEEALLREVFEETGLQVAITRKVARYYPINRLTSTTHIFECRPLSGTPKLSPETNGIAFFPISRLPEAFFTVHRDWLNDALENRSAPLNKPIDQVTYWALFRYFLQHPLQTIRALLARLGLPINY